jgi:hypothetical protein
MTDTGVVNSIRSMLDGVTAYDDLKTVARDVQRRSLQLDADKAALFTKGQRVFWQRRGRRAPGLVERVEGGKVLVKLDHGFIARIAPGELRPGSSATHDPDCSDAPPKLRTG